MVLLVIIATICRSKFLIVGSGLNSEPEEEIETKLIRHCVPNVYRLDFLWTVQDEGVQK